MALNWKFGTRALAALALAVCCAGAMGQSLNLDLNIDDELELGGGVPSPAFGAAANQPGVWSSIGTNGNASWVFDLQGNIRPILVTTASSSGNFMGGGFRNLTNTGDYARLLNDAAHVSGAWRSWTLSGLANGTYMVTTYAVQYSSDFSRAEVHVSNSLVPNPQIVQGVMPGNQLVLGVTHSFHFATVTSGTLEIKVFKGAAPNYPMVNGFQLTMVSEPSTIVFLTIASAGFIARRRPRQ